MVSCVDQISSFNNFSQDVVSYNLPLPDCVCVLGQSIQLLYYRMRQDMVTAHNQRLRQEIGEGTQLIRDITRGLPSLDYPDLDKLPGEALGFIGKGGKGDVPRGDQYYD